MNISTFEFVAKAKQSQHKLDEIMAKVYNKYMNAGTGSDGYQFEKAVEQEISACGVKNEYVQSAGKIDRIVYLPGDDGKKRRVRIEIKSGSGIVAQLKPRLGFRTIADFTESCIMPSADLVIYAAKPGDFTCLDDLLDNSAVLTRTEFITMVSENCGKRKSGFESGFSVQCNNSTLADKNRALPAMVTVTDENGETVLGTDGKPALFETERKITDKKTGEEKTTRRGCPRWTDCIVMQTTYLDSRAAAVDLGLATGEYTSLRTWLEDNGRA